MDYFADSLKNPFCKIINIIVKAKIDYFFN